MEILLLLNDHSWVGRNIVKQTNQLEVVISIIKNVITLMKI